MRYNFLFPIIRKTFPCVKGAVNANAHGQATIRIAVKTLNAVFTLIKTHYKNDTKASVSNVGVK